MGMSYEELQACARIDNVIQLIRNMGEKHNDAAAKHPDEFVIRELEEAKRLLKLGDDESSRSSVPNQG